MWNELNGNAERRVLSLVPNNSELRTYNSELGEAVDSELRTSLPRQPMALRFLDWRKVANDNLGNFLEIAVRCQDRKPMLHGAGGNQNIVGGNRGAGLFEEGRDDGPSVRGFVVDSEDAHSGRSEKLS